ncbi:MAG: translocation/assembly module TamB [Bacteroidales bacterium]|nr:translocation/assembly module TamB [Bacteroidales bacterium]
MKKAVLTVVLTPVILLAIFIIPPVNSAVTGIVSTILSQKYSSEISISHLYIDPFSLSVWLKEVLVKDQTADTLLYAKRLHANLDKFDTETLTFEFKKVDLKEVTVKLIQDTSQKFNFDFFIPEDSTEIVEEDSSKTPFKIIARDIALENINFTLRTPTSEMPPKDFQMDYNNLVFRDINLFVKDFSLDDSLNINALIRHLEAKEKCGFFLKNLSTVLDFSTKGITLENLNIMTDETDFYSDKTILKFNGFQEFGDNLSNIVTETNILENTKVGFNDIGHFVPEVYSTDITAGISGKISGKIGCLDIKRLKLSLTDSTTLKINAFLKGLPDMDKFYFRLDTAVLSTSSADIRALHSPISKNTPLFDLPDFLDGLGIVKLCAKSSGSINKLSLNAVLRSKLGNLKTKIRLNNTNKFIDINGLIDAGGMNLAAIAGPNSGLGILSARFDTIGVKIFPNGTISGIAKGGIDSASFNGYNYKNIIVNGDFTDKLFNGKLAVNDPNLDVKFSGKADISDKMNFDFVLDVMNVDLKALNFMTDSVDRIKFAMAAKFSGNSLDNFNGNVVLTEPFEYQRDNDTLVVNSLALKSYIDQYKNNLPIRNLRIDSDFFAAELKGLVQTEQMQKIAGNLIYMIFPSLKGSEKEAVTRKKRQRYGFDDPNFVNNYDNRFEFEFFTGDTKKLTNFFLPGLSISQGTHLGASVNARRGQTYFVLETDSVVYGDYSAENILIRASAKHDTLDFGLDISRFCLLDEELMKPHLGISAKHDTAAISLGWNNTNEKLSVIKGNFYMLPQLAENKFPVLKFAFENSDFNFFDTDFKILPSVITMDSTAFEVENFRIAILGENDKNDNYDFSINGKISEDASDKISIGISEFDISILEKFIPGISFKGLFNGDFSVSKVYSLRDGGLPVVEMHASSEKLNIEGIDLKNLSADALLNEKDSIINLNISTLKRKNDTIKAISAYGNYDFKTERADLGLDLNDLPLNYFKKFFENYLQTSKYSLLTGHARVIGKLDNPLINAALTLHGGYFKIQYLGTQYDLNDSMAITLDNKLIKLSKTKFYSGKGTGIAYLDGILTHNNFNNFNMNVNLSCKNFMVLNAKETDSSAFWGKAYTSGAIKISGDPMRMINIEAKVKTDKNTQVFLPLYMASEVATDWDFITFTNPSTDTEIHRQKADLSDIKMNFNLEVTPDAEVHVLMDETGGNNLNVSAKGNLRLDVSGSGDFNMYGTLNVVKGDYLFTMQHMLSKKFEITSGGSLRWNGDPLDAIVDLSASYRLRKVNLYNLMVEESYRNKKVPVRCFLNMKGDLMQPKVSFNVKVEENSDVVQGQLDNLDEGNINKQAMSLLLLNQFQPLPGLKSSENSMFSDINPGELVSNQLNHWLSDISDKVDVGVNYQIGDGNTTSEFDVAVSTQLLDDRVNVSTNFGVGGTSQNQAANRANNVVGEVEVDVKLNKSGGVQLKVYNKANDDELDQAPYVQGVGVIFKRDFDRIRLFGRRKKEEVK